MIELDVLKDVLVQFAQDPCKAWGPAKVTESNGEVSEQFINPFVMDRVDSNHRWYSNDHDWSMTAQATRYIAVFTWYSGVPLWSNEQQELTLVRENGIITRVTLFTVAMRAGRIYGISWDLTSGSTEFYAPQARWFREVAAPPSVPMLDTVVFDLIVAMIPPFMLRTYASSRSKSPVFMRRGPQHG